MQVHLLFTLIETPAHLCSYSLNDHVAAAARCFNHTGAGQEHQLMFTLNTERTATT